MQSKCAWELQYTKPSFCMSNSYYCEMCTTHNSRYHVIIWRNLEIPSHAGSDDKKILADVEVKVKKFQNY